jgi:D-xylose transport system permease protein
MEQKSTRIGRFLAALELDVRLLGMVLALLAIWIVFDIFSGGSFITPRNLFNISIQSASVMVMATGMVFVIVTRHIDLSVGSILGFIGMMIGVLQVNVLPDLIGQGHAWMWLIALLSGIFIGALIGGIQGTVIAYLGVPAFIVTLGGLLVWRGAAWWVTSGQTVAPMDPTFKLLGGGVGGTIGYWPSLIVGLVCCVLIVLGLINGRRQRKRFDFPLRPVWAEFVLAGLGVAVVMGIVGVANSYHMPSRVAKRYAEANGLMVPEGGLEIAYGLPIPVLIAIAVAIVMTFMAQRTRFGRYVFAQGGNPEAAELSGINTKAMTVAIFSLMGMLCGLAAAISTARLNASTNATGTLDELMVIAAAVIGGTSLNGGVGTIVGAVLGALVMQSLQSGMVLLGFDAPLQNMVVGVVLVLAVYIDIVYRRRAG